MENGASGYILKNSSKEELIRAIHVVHGGGIYFSGEAGQALGDYQKSSKNALPELTPREKEILELIARRIHQSADSGKDIPQSVYS